MVFCGKPGEMPMSQQESAETLAIQALTWLVNQPEDLGAFLAASGASGAELASLAAEPAFLGAVLDFLLEADTRIVAFCDAANLPYSAPMQARAALPGGREWHWT
jgi:hypothetical protein